MNILLSIEPVLSSAGRIFSCVTLSVNNMLERWSKVTLEYGRVLAFKRWSTITIIRSPIILLKDVQKVRYVTFEPGLRNHGNRLRIACKQVWRTIHFLTNCNRDWPSEEITLIASFYCINPLRQFPSAASLGDNCSISKPLYVRVVMTCQCFFYLIALHCQWAVGTVELPNQFSCCPLDIPALFWRQHAISRY